MYPLNGPSWSLFFEYIGNILYALFIRRMSTKALTILVVIAGIGLASFSICNLSGSHHLGVGWSMIDYNLIGGFLRMLFAFSIGLLMSRIFKPVHIKGAFWICSLSILILLTMPYVGGETSPWMNGIYDAVCTILIFHYLSIWVLREKRQIKVQPKSVNSWRYILSGIYHTLSFHVSVLCLVMEQRATYHFLPVMAGSLMCLLRKHCVGLPLPETV